MLKGQIRIKIVACDLVNTILLLLVTQWWLHCMFCILCYHGTILWQCQWTWMTKEFVVVEAIENQVANTQHGPDSYSIARYGYMVLEAFIRLHPDLRQNRTGEIIGKLVGPRCILCIIHYLFIFLLLFLCWTCCWDTKSTSVIFSPVLYLVTILCWNSINMVRKYIIYYT